MIARQPGEAIPQFCPQCLDEREIDPAPPEQRVNLRRITTEALTHERYRHMMRYQRPDRSALVDQQQETRVRFVITQTG
jgi:hypothetical protein